MVDSPLCVECVDLFVLAQDIAEPSTETAQAVKGVFSIAWAQIIAAFSWLWDTLYPHRFTLNNLIVLLLIALFAFGIFKAWRNRYWRGVMVRLFRVKRALISFIVLVVFVVIGTLDSISWRDYQMDNDGKIMTKTIPVEESDDGSVLETTTIKLMTPEGRTLLDRLDGVLLNLSGQNERTYSKPFADIQFTRETVVRETGETARIKPELDYPYRHPLGTDQIGADVLYKAMKGVRTALIIGGFTTVLAIPFALFFGMMAGYYGKWIDDIIMYIYTVLASIPRVLLIIAFVVAFEQGLFQLCVIMGITTWVYLGRLIRGETLKVREMDYVQAAKAAGASGLRIQMRHILPNVFHLVVIRAVLMFSGLVLAEAVLTYLNVGVGSDVGSWGRMINEGRVELSREPIIWWNITAAFIFMFTLLLAANVFGDVVRDSLDPRLKDVK